MLGVIFSPHLLDSHGMRLTCYLVGVVWSLCVGGFLFDDLNVGDIRQHKKQITNH